MSKVKIAARLRPKLPAEVDDGGIHVERHDEYNGTNGRVVVANPRDPSQNFKFSFASAYPPEASQAEIFERDVRPLVDVVFSGVTVTIFAYGVTSSGKTHTMQGTAEDPGVIPRMVKELFARRDAIDAASSSSSECPDDISFTVSYMEIYKDECYDLFVVRETAPKLPVRENDVGQVFVANLSSVPVSSVQEFENTYARANKRRSVGSTNLNRASSRSHAVLTIEIRITTGFVARTGKINLVDLAGSENNKQTGNDASRMAESSAINRSLSVLGQVVHALNSGASRIPYRDSKLTRILQDALGGSSVGLLICNLAPGNRFRQDTLNTLNFAVRTKNIENKPVVNERDNRPAPKPHFAAIPSKPPKMPAATLACVAAAAASSSTEELAVVSMEAPRGITGPRASLGPRPVPAAMAGSSKVPRRSSIVVNGGGVFQPFALGIDVVPEEPPRKAAVGMSTEEIEERIAKAVEKEVMRRLAERDAERQRQEEAAQESSRRSDTEPVVERADESLPSGVLTPVLRKQQDLDAELKNRLEDLERKVDRGEKEVQLADILSPVSKKKTGRAYVALARAHSEKGDLKVALDLYKKAQSYVPDNNKLRERIIEIEWCVKNESSFAPSPKKGKKSKGHKKSKARTRSRSGALDAHDDDNRDALAENDEVEELLDQEEQSKAGRPPRRAGDDFGVEVTNHGSLSKRIREEEREAVGTPPRKQRRGGVAKSVAEATDQDLDGEDDEWAPEVPGLVETS